MTTAGNAIQNVLDYNTRVTSRPPNTGTGSFYRRVQVEILPTVNKAQIVQYAGSGNWIGDATSLAGEGVHTRADILTVAGVNEAESWFTKLAEGLLPPQAMDDEVSGIACEPIHIHVLANDQPGSSAILVRQVRVVVQPQYGSAVVNSDGSITYRARSGYLGQDSFRYEITDEEGQTAVATVYITLESCPVRVPNVFTPNGDGINDNFEIEGLEQFDRVELLVFNRWGNEVYRSTNYQNNWNGQNLLEGVYYYRLTTYQGGNRQHQEGWVLLKRN